MIEERQRLADEYLKEEGRKNPGFDIAEELRSLSDPEDELYDRKDLFYSFDDRKQELLEYTELTVEDVNMAMYWKDDISATGINHHLLERQRPLSEYGAIFRLEGVLVDMVSGQRS